MKLFLKLSAFGILALSLTGCLPGGDKDAPIVAEPAVFEENADVLVDEAPLPTAREAVRDEDGEITSNAENLWRNRDENSDSRS